MSTGNGPLERYGVEQGPLSSLQDGLRREAEAGVPGTQTTLTTPHGKAALAQIVQSFAEILTLAGQRLTLMHGAMVNAYAANPTEENRALLARVIQLLTYYAALATGFATYTREADASERAGKDALGVSSVVVAVVVVAVAALGIVIACSVTGVSWAVTHYNQAAALRDEVALLDKNPAMAAALANINAGGGKGPGGGGDGLNMGVVLGVGVGLLALGGAAWAVMRSKG